MSLLVVEIVLALVALQRGWRAAPLLLLAPPVGVLAFPSVVAPWIAPWVGPYFEPAGVAKALAHGLSLIGLVIACWAAPSERLIKRVPAGPAQRRATSLYQI